MARHDEYIWKEALGKVVREGKCRNCSASKRHVKLDAAHTVNRKKQDVWTKEYRGEKTDNGAPLMSTIRTVPADAIIPLCRTCHELHDAHKLDILPLLDPDKNAPQVEQANAVAALGIVGAMRRLTGQRELFFGSKAEMSGIA